MRKKNYFFRLVAYFNTRGRVEVLQKEKIFEDDDSFKSRNGYGRSAILSYQNFMVP